MQALSEENIEKIRQYWTDHYSRSEQLESLHVKVDKIQRKADRFEENRSLVPYDNLFDFLTENCDFFGKLLNELKIITRKIVEVQKLIDQDDKTFDLLLEELQLAKEERSYDEDLYNLVNGLEDDSMYMRISESE
jgi:phosphatidylserine/phosphatidylglycerophosphate/cardiolipin synthase-like enzyme